MKAIDRPQFALAHFCVVAGLCVVAGVGRAADASSNPTAADGRWIPSASFFSTGLVEDRVARMASDTSPSLEGDTQGLVWTAGGTVDIASPVILDVAFKPRFFAHADIGHTFDSEDPVVTEGDPGDPPFLTPGFTTVFNIENVGSSVRAEAKPIVLSGGLGTVLSFEAFDRGFRFRPTLEWIYRRDTMLTRLGGGEVQVQGSTANDCAPCRTLFIKGQTEKGFHSIGPGFELEADVGRTGPLLVGFYGSFRAYYLVGDRKANLRSRGSWFRTDNGQPSTRADTVFVTRYEREPWHYRFGLGIRILWSPEE